MPRTTAVYFHTKERDFAYLSDQHVTLRDYVNAMAYGCLAYYEDYGCPERPDFARHVLSARKPADFHRKNQLLFRLDTHRFL